VAMVKVKMMLVVMLALQLQTDLLCIQKKGNVTGSLPEGLFLWAFTVVQVS